MKVDTTELNKRKIYKRRRSERIGYYLYCIACGFLFAMIIIVAFTIN